MIENRTVGFGPLSTVPEYGTRQPEVAKAMMEAWNWLERAGLLIKDPQMPGDWYSISREGEKMLRQFDLEEKLQALGLDRVKDEFLNGIYRVGNGPNEFREAVSAWVQKQEGLFPLNSALAGQRILIAETRLEELRALRSPQFDFQKLIRLCEELNIVFRENCYFATAMLIRGLLDHIPPIFEKRIFDEVANNYGGQSFKGIMQHLQNVSRKVADGHLHLQIRKTEAVPTAQQVNCGQQLDFLLEEIIRITRERNAAG